MLDVPKVGDPREGDEDDKNIEPYKDSDHVFMPEKQTYMTTWRWLSRNRGFRFSSFHASGSDFGNGKMSHGPNSF